MTYQLLPDLTPDEYAELREDIREHGIRVPVDLDENGNVLDGHHRVRLAEEFGYDYDTRVIEGLTDEEKREHALAVNVHRRQLSRDQKRELIRRSLTADPGLSDRQHAERTGTDHKTVGSQRSQMVASGEIPQSSRSVGADGTERVRPTSASEPDDEPDLATVDMRTGEIVEDDDEHERAAEDARRDRELDAEMAETAARFRANFSRALARADDVWQFDLDRIVELYSPPGERQQLLFWLREMQTWCQRVETAVDGRRMRVVQGGRS